ncbi:MAG TPA: hypothetical protein VJ725_26920 [Thermoanaerobaculia bacterium]|nr:hypothetical protein [Thermoanaerobaculia bacterium]
MKRKMISLVALTLLLTASLAFAGLETESRYPGCSKTCKQDRDCPAYPEQVCISGCCVY